MHRHPDYDDSFAQPAAQPATTSTIHPPAPPPQAPLSRQNTIAPVPLHQAPPSRQNATVPPQPHVPPAPHPQSPSLLNSRPAAPNPNSRSSVGPPPPVLRPSPPKPHQTAPEPHPHPPGVKLETASPNVVKPTTNQTNPPSDDYAFAFHSDDDKFMAQCDFDDTVPDDDLGRPIHEGLDGADVTTTTSTSIGGCTSARPPPSGKAGPSGQQLLRQLSGSGMLCPPNASGSHPPSHATSSNQPVAQPSKVASPPNAGFQRSSSIRNENVPAPQPQQPQRHQQSFYGANANPNPAHNGQRPLQSLDTVRLHMRCEVNCYSLLIRSQNAHQRQQASPPNQIYKQQPQHSVKQAQVQAHGQNPTGMMGPLGNAVSSLKRDAGVMQYVLILSFTSQNQNLT